MYSLAQLARIRQRAVKRIFKILLMFVKQDFIALFSSCPNIETVEGFAETKLKAAVVTLTEAYAREIDKELRKARSSVFMLEQRIICLDMDNVDYGALHVFFETDGLVTASGSARKNSWKKASRT